jgi:hypothetical protein
MPSDRTSGNRLRTWRRGPLSFSSGESVGFTDSVLHGLRYGSDGSLFDDAGHVWQRVSDWVEPADAANLANGGIQFVVQMCNELPKPVRKERFKPDVGARMLTRSAAESAAARTQVPTILVGELWRSAKAGYLLAYRFACQS